MTAANASNGSVLAAEAETWDLRLYTAGQTPKSLAAIRNLKRICEEHLRGRYHIEVIDLMANPRLAKDDQIVAIPTLVRKLPDPLRKVVGDLSDEDRTRMATSRMADEAPRSERSRSRSDPPRRAPSGPNGSPSRRSQPRKESVEDR